MVQSFISERLNLFLMTISPQTNKFSMYMIDLDTFKMSPKPVFSFPMSDVIDNPNLYKIHVRSTSEKELNNYNLKTIAFMKFATSLYSWTEA